MSRYSIIRAAIGAAALTGGSLVLSAAPTVHAVADVKPVTVVSYNLAGAMPKPLAAGGIHPFTDQVAAYVKRSGAQVIGLQEVCWPQAVSIGATLGPGYRTVFTKGAQAARCDDYLSKKQRAKYGTWWGTAVIVKATNVTGVKVTQLPWQADPAGTPGRHPRQLTCLTAEISGPVSVCNTHLSPSPHMPGDTHEDPNLGALAQQIPIVRAELARRASYGRLIAVGDWNTNCDDIFPAQYAALTEGLANADVDQDVMNKPGNSHTIDYHLAGPDAEVIEPLAADRSIRVSDHVPTRSVIQP